jgi:hypothetical protein
MAPICYRRYGGRLIHSFPLSADWDHVKPWFPYRRVWTIGSYAAHRQTVVYVDTQLKQ